MIASFFSPGTALAALLAQASPVDTVPVSTDSNDLAKQFDSILAAPAPPSQTRKTQGPAGSGLMNPDISVIFDGTAGAANRPRASSAGDDPDFTGPAARRTGGFAVQEVEVGFQSTVDPYFAANVFLTIPNLQGIEVEEAYAVTTSLPAGLQLKLGVFRSAAGRQNEQHLHMQDFSLRPLLNQAYLGADGLRSPGAQLSWLLPLPFFLRLTGEALTVTPGTSPTLGVACAARRLFWATRRPSRPSAKPGPSFSAPRWRPGMRRRLDSRRATTSMATARAPCWRAAISISSTCRPITS